MTSLPTVAHFEDEPWDSGMVSYALTLAAAQRRAGLRVAVWGREHSPLLAQAVALGLEAHSLGSRAAAWLSFPILARELREFGADVVNAHTGSSHALALAVRGKAALVRTRADARMPSGGPINACVARRTNAFIAANSSLAAALARRFPASRIRMVPQGIEGPPAVPPLPPEPVIGILGRLDPVKGHAYLFEAIAKLAPRFPNIRLRCAGEGRLMQPLLEKIRSLGLEGTVEMAGQVPDKWEFIASCRIGAVSSLASEAVSRAGLEWMAAGRPLVAARVGGLPDLVEDGVSGALCAPGDSASLAAALEKILSSPATSASAGARGRERWSERHSPEAFEKSTREVYAAAIADFSH